MLKKQPFIVATFYTTAAAVAMEKACKAHAVPGRLFPAPRSLTADCGIAWCSPASEEAALRALIASEGLETETVARIEL